MDHLTEAKRKTLEFAPTADMLMAGLAVLIIAWAIARACLQSITIDEAMTYGFYAGAPDPLHWLPSSNNHVLNSLLMRLATSIFGLSHLTVRLPALVGACIYVASCFFLCRSVIDETVARVVVFICLTLNPFLCDFYVAARGYSLAVGFLACAIALIAAWNLRGTEEVTITPLTAWIPASAAIGLSFVANFPFAFIDFGVWVGLLTWTLSRAPRTTQERLRILAAATLPALGTVLLLGSWTLLRWPKGHLFDGALSLAETFRSVAAPSLFDPNPEVANPLVMDAARTIRPAIPLRTSPRRLDFSSEPSSATSTLLRPIRI